MKKLFLLLLVPFSVNAFQNEPDGFRGLKWGSKPPKNMTVWDSEKDSNMYARKGDKMSIGPAKLDDIFYFYDKKWGFTSVYITTSGKANKKTLIEVFKNQFGKPIRPNRYMDKYFWRGAVTIIYLGCLSFDHKCEVMIKSTRSIKRESAEKDKKIQQSGGDF